MEMEMEMEHKVEGEKERWKVREFAHHLEGNRIYESSSVCLAGCSLSNFCLKIRRFRNARLAGLRTVKSKRFAARLRNVPEAEDSLVSQCKTFAMQDLLATRSQIRPKVRRRQNMRANSNRSQSLSCVFSSHKPESSLQIPISISIFGSTLACCKPQSAACKQLALPLLRTGARVQCQRGSCQRLSPNGSSEAQQVAWDEPCPRGQSQSQFQF